MEPVGADPSFALLCGYSMGRRERSSVVCKGNTSIENPAVDAVVPAEAVFHFERFATMEVVQIVRDAALQISSVHASRPYVNASPYNAAKAAVNHMSATWALELTPHRIRVNIIEPGWIDTPGERAFLSDEQLRAAALELPLARLGTPEEIARGAVYLASDDASYVTGAVLRIDGAYALAR